MVWRGPEEGPVLGITAAVHGDEINGTGAILRIRDGRVQTLECFSYEEEWPVVEGLFRVGKRSQ